MAINYTRLGQRLGKIAGALNEVNTYRNTTLGGRVTSIAGQYTSVNPNVPAGIYDAQVSADAAFTGWLSYLSSLMASIVVHEVKNDRPQGDGLRENLIELERQMRNDSASFASSACTATVSTVGSPTGETVFAANVKDGKGVNRDYVVPDSYVLVISSDASTGATRYQESVSVAGKPIDSSPTDKAYPSGFGINTTLSLRDPAANAFSTDGDFSSWPSTGDLNDPTYWDAFTGSVTGTNVFKVADDARTGAEGYALKLVSTGARVRVFQEVTVTPNTAYAAHFRVRPKVDGGNHPKVSLRLVDIDGTALTDASGGACAITSGAYNTLNDDLWTNPVKGFIFTPTVIPADGVFLEITLHGAASIATAADNTDQVYVDHVWFGRPDSLYTGGPDVVGFSGLTAPVRGDEYAVAVALASGAVADSLLRAMDRLLGLRTISGVSLPSSGSPTISDSVVG